MVWTSVLSSDIVEGPSFLRVSCLLLLTFWTRCQASSEPLALFMKQVLLLVRLADLTTVAEVLKDNDWVELRTWSIWPCELAVLAYQLKNQFPWPQSLRTMCQGKGMSAQHLTTVSTGLPHLQGNTNGGGNKVKTLLSHSLTLSPFLTSQVLS